MADNALTNPNKAQYEAWVGGMETTIRNTNEANKAIINNAAGTETSLVNQRDAQKYARLNQQEQRLNNIENTFDQQVSERRWDLDTIRKRQEAIASRNANMAVAQAGQGGLQLSEWEKQAINEDTQAKYWENIASADQARYQWNVALDQAQKGTKLEVYAKRSDINGLLASLDDAGKAALIDAARKARDGDLEAEKQVANSILEYQKKQADEQYTRYATVERQNAEENLFRNSTIEQKIAQLTANVWQTPGADLSSKNIRDVIDKYPGASFEELTNILKYQSNQWTYAQDLTKAGVQAGTINPKDNSALSTLATTQVQAVTWDATRNTNPLGSSQTTYGNKFPATEVANNQTQTTWLKYPTTQEISQVKQVLDRWLSSKTLTQKEYDRYQLGLNKIQKNGMDAQAYANTYGNPAWLARLGKAK